jgi:integrase
MPLTDDKVRSLKARAAPYKVSDSCGLYLLVPSTGSKLWRLAYRFGEKQKCVALGKYPEVSLADARQARDYAKRLLADGYDPAAVKKANKRADKIAASETFCVVAEAWFETKKRRWVKSFGSRMRTRLDVDLLPALGSRPIAHIQPLEVLNAVRKVEERGAVHMAKRVMQIASAIFRYGVATAKCHRNPTVDLRGSLRRLYVRKHRTALSPRDLPAFMDCLERFDGPIITKLALNLVLLTLVRTTELRFARWSEFEDIEGQEPLWRIPAERMKMRRPHLVPLSPQAVQVLRQLRGATEGAAYLFRAPTARGILPANAMLFALYRMGYRNRATVHGLRATASTVLNDAEFNRDWIEMQLSHRRAGAPYNPAEWLPGRRRMLGWWADHLTHFESSGAC